MKTTGTKEYVYFLSLKQAEQIAAEHEGEDWDLWSDIVAIRKGFFNHYDEMMAKAKRSAS